MPDLDGIVETASRALAERFSRRSLLAGLGKGGVAVSLGSAGAIAMDAVAVAHDVNCPCPGGCVHSVTCYELTGNGDSCPPGTDGCGYWTVCASPCTGRKVWSDCCSTGSACNGGAGCHAGAPTCYFHKTYSCGCCSYSAHVKCRRWYCTSGGTCNTSC